MKNKFWMMSRVNPKKGEIKIYSDIVDSVTSWWEPEMTAREFESELRWLGEVDEIDVRINSNGGSPIAGSAIYNLLRNHPAKINTYVDGIAASSASMIFMAGDKRFMPKASFLMVHNPYISASGNAEELRKMAETLDTIRDGVLTAYERSGKTKEELTALLDAETWMTGEMALENGFATDLMEDEVTLTKVDDLIMINNIKFNMSKNTGFQNFIMKAGIIIKEEKEDMKTVEEFRKAHPEMFNEIVATAKKEGAEEERARMKAIDDIAMEGAEEIIMAAKYTEPKSAAEVSMAICMAMKEGKIVMEKATEGSVQTNPIDNFSMKKLDAQMSGTGDVTEGGNVTPEDKAKSLADKIAMKLNTRRGY